MSSCRIYVDNYVVLIFSILLELTDDIFYSLLTFFQMAVFAQADAYASEELV